jgi:preprotein translocase SecE subunit
MALGTEELDVPAEEELAELATNGRAVVRGGGEAAAARPARRASILQRLITFLQGSWAELHRVQWPDRRQVLQATGVVIGFVIVAGVFLGLSDLASSHLMDWILK